MEEEEKDFVILPENKATIELWFRVDNLWNATMGGISSLDWASVNGKIQLIESRSDFEITIEMIEGIEIMERVAVSEMGKKD